MPRPQAQVPGCPGGVGASDLEPSLRGFECASRVRLVMGRGREQGGLPLRLYKFHKEIHKTKKIIPIVKKFTNRIEKKLSCNYRFVYSWKCTFLNSLTVQTVSQIEAAALFPPFLLLPNHTLT